MDSSLAFDVLGISVTRAHVEQWREWLMPPVQPYLVNRRSTTAQQWADQSQELTPQLRDSFEIYDIPDDAVLVWLTRTQSRTLPPDARREQPAAHRWPTSWLERDLEQTIAYVKLGRRPSRHREITPSHWAEIDHVLPQARALAGTFPAGSGPNCFGTVMGAAGVEGAATTWMQREPFEEWLAEHTEPGGADDDLGTVLVWRNTAGAVEHAAVTLGQGYLLHKPGQGWFAPTKVLAVQEGKYSSRGRGHRLSRYRMR